MCWGAFSSTQHSSSARQCSMPQAECPTRPSKLTHLPPCHSEAPSCACLGHTLRSRCQATHRSFSMYPNSDRPAGTVADRPEVARQWHTVKNGAFTPQMFGSGSAYRMWWQCPGCACGAKHEWQARCGLPPPQTDMLPPLPKSCAPMHKAAYSCCPCQPPCSSH